MFKQIKCWFSVEGEKHLAPLDSLSVSLSSLQEMRRSLEHFTEEAAVSRLLHIVLVCTVSSKRLFFTLSLTACVCVYLIMFSSGISRLQR